MTTAVDTTTDLSCAGVVGVDELHLAFRSGGSQRVAVLGDHALVYGHVPAAQAILAAATVWGLDPTGDPDATATLAADPPTWVIVHRHDLTCTTGGNPTECGCAPPSDPNSLCITGATEDTPGAAPVTPVRRPDDSYAAVDAVVCEHVDGWLAHPAVRQTLAQEGPAPAAAHMVSLLADSGRNAAALRRMAAHLLVRQMLATRSTEGDDFDGNNR